MQTYQIAKTMLAVLMYAGWAVVALCIIGGFIVMYETNTNAFGVIIGVCIASVSGLLIVAIGQMGLAQIATAENTGEMLQIMRGQVQSTSPAMKPTSTSTGASLDRQFVKGVGSVIKAYKGYEIVKTEDGVDVEGEAFPNLFAAEKWINDNPKA